MQRSELTLTALLAVLIIAGSAYESYRGAGKTAEVIITHPGSAPVDAASNAPLLDSPILSVTQTTSVASQPMIDPVESGSQRLLKYLNTATPEQLEKLPGIGKVLGQRILERRLKLGSFKRIEDVLEVDGIGESKLNKILSYIISTPPTRSPQFVPTLRPIPVFPLPTPRNPSSISNKPKKLPSLRTATKEELMTVPGIGESLAEVILQARQQQKGFRNWQEVDKIPGIGKQRLELLKSRFTIP